MSTFTAPSGRVYERDTDLIEVTCLHRPDESWRFTDPAGHEHFWVFNGVRGSYSPNAKAEVPSTVWVKDGEEYWEDDDEPHDVGHHECATCGAVVVLGYTSDSTRQFMPGLSSCSIDGERVSEETFKAEIAKELEALQ